MEVIFLEGESGGGKTYSLRNIKPGISAYISPNAKPLPWRGAAKDWAGRVIHTKELKDLPGVIRQCVNNGIKIIVIDDFTHFQNARLLSAEFLAAGTSKDNKFTRWETFGRDLYNAIFGLQDEFAAKQVYVILINHTMKDQDGERVFKTFGKMTGNTVDPVSYARVVLHARVIAEESDPEKRYVFQTNSDGQFEAKSPPGMFSGHLIPNDMDRVLRAIYAYDNPPAAQPENAAKEE